MVLADWMTRSHSMLLSQKLPRSIFLLLSINLTRSRPVLLSIEMTRSCLMVLAHQVDSLIMVVTVTRWDSIYLYAPVRGRNVVCVTFLIQDVWLRWWCVIPDLVGYVVPMGKEQLNRPPLGSCVYVCRW